MDQRNQKLAENLVNYSVSLKKGEKLLVEVKGVDGIPLAELIVNEAYKVGAYPFVEIFSEKIDRSLLMGTSKEHALARGKYEEIRMKDMDAYIAIRSGSNTAELSDIPQENNSVDGMYHARPVADIRCGDTKWCVLRYPNASMAQKANTSVENFTTFFYNVCNFDYAKMSEAMTPLKNLMEKTDKVHIVGSGTDLTFSIKGLPAIKCVGDRNIPDGEIYTAPVRDSVNGTLTYNTPSPHSGFVFENIHFEFKNGKIIKATSNNTELINEILDVDEGARYIGEFSFGVNPYILMPMQDTLFDEKIAGSFHFTPGAAYDVCNNGNKSVNHWDLVCIQREDFGGGEIYFDDILIRKNGLFVLPELENLNPEKLIKIANM